MKSSIISFALTAYAVYSALKNKSRLNEQLDRIVDIENNQELLDSAVKDLTTKTYNLLDQNIKVDYTFICGRPTSMKKMSGSLHFTITNTSTTNTYIIKAVMFEPILGTTICTGLNGQKLMNLYWKAGVALPPGHSYSRYICYNDLKLESDVLATVWNDILTKFQKNLGWSKLGDRYGKIENGCSADIWVLANAPYVDAAHDYVISKTGQPGLLYWHGGNYLPGSTPKEAGEILKLNAAKEVFRLA